MPTKPVITSFHKNVSVVAGANFTQSCDVLEKSKGYSFYINIVKGLAPNAPKVKVKNERRKQYGNNK